MRNAVNSHFISLLLFLAVSNHITYVFQAIGGKVISNFTALLTCDRHLDRIYLKI